MRDFFPDIVNEGIMKEALMLKDKFKEATTGVPEYSLKDKKIRSNLTAEYDNLYFGKRYDSVLLRAIDQTFAANADFRMIMATSGPPFMDFGETNYSDTQVSRYGGLKPQHYSWHVDRFIQRYRMISLVYYFFKEPKQFQGGELQLTNSPTKSHEEIAEEHPDIFSIIPENNMMVVFASDTVHRVMPTTSPEEWETGRFAVNSWIGNK